MLNRPLSVVDFTGQWGKDVHLVYTSIWAEDVGIKTEGADLIGENDHKVDGNGWFGFWSEIGGTGPMPWQDQSYHFNRNLAVGQPDSRLVHSNRHFIKALELCTWSGGSGKDEAVRSSEAVGASLHPLQDWVAHGDYGIRNNGNVWVKHNDGGPLVSGVSGDAWKYPDMITLDAVGGDAFGRAVGDVTTGGALTFTSPWHASSATATAVYTFGSLRFNRTKDLSVSSLNSFIDWVRTNAKPCGRCRALFLKNDDPRRYR
jgi:hypothetical protein